MAFQVSPGVNVTEIDATTIVPSVATSNAAIACAFKWGPVDVITTISSENDLAKVFGIPDNDTATNWLTASSFLAYSGGLQVVRTIDSTHKNSTDGLRTEDVCKEMPKGTFIKGPGDKFLESISFKLLPL